jgi:acyl-CoA synthetase (AMP-forming)/AMP-acid ligase II/acyl carrier protein
MIRFTSLWALLVQQARRHPERVAITAPGRALVTYRALRQRAESVMRVLHAAGIRRRDRVAIVLPNGPEMAGAFLGVSCVATSAPLNPTYRAEEYDFYFDDLEAKALIVDPALDSSAAAVARARNMPVIELVARVTAEAGAFQLCPPPGGAAASDAQVLDQPTAHDVALVLHTSGTTARPKLVPLTHGNLCASAAQVAAALELTEQDRCLNVMPLFHVHGLVAALLGSLAAGASVVCTPGFFVTQFFAWLDETAPTWYTAVPTMHQSIAARAPAHRDIITRGSLRFIRSSSSALPPALMAELEAAFGAPVIEAYGMTEAAHQIASNPLPPRGRKPGSVGLPAGPEIGILADTGELLPAGAIGEIVIRGPGVTRGYERNPEANASGFTDGWFRTGDQGRMDIDGYLYITTRLKEIINRGGEKISPREIEEVLLSHPAVAQAVAFAVPDARLGEDVAAAVVLRAGESADGPTLRAFASSRLTYFKVPRVVQVLTELPKGATGKVQRIGLAARLGMDMSAPSNTALPAYRPPRTTREHVLADIWREVLGTSRVGLDDSFLDLGGDSMLATQLVSRVREWLGLNVTLRALFDAPTIATQVALLEALAPQRTSELQPPEGVRDVRAHP